MVGMKRLLSAPGRLVAVLLIAVLIGPTAVWWHYVGRLLVGCASGYGNQRVSGDPGLAQCTLSVAGEPAYRYGWLGDLATAVGLLLALLAAVLVVLAPARGALRPLLALLPVPMLLLVVAMLRNNGWAPAGLVRMSSGFLAERATEPPADDAARVHTFGVEGYPDGWRVRVPGASIFMPALGPMWIFAVCVAMCVAVVLALVVWWARFGPASVTVRRTPQWSGSRR